MASSEGTTLSIVLDDDTLSLRLPVEQARLLMAFKLLTPTSETQRTIQIATQRAGAPAVWVARQERQERQPNGAGCAADRSFKDYVGRAFAAAGV